MTELNMNRRRALRTVLGVAGAIACPICSAFAEDKHVHWTYGGDEGPSEWGGLSADFKSCRIGMQQTPINLKTAVSGRAGVLQSSFQPMPLTILNNGHTIQVVCAPGSHTVIGNDTFNLVQFHFHHPSEHLLSGKVSEMELHFVHKADDGRLAVLGVFIQIGAENAALKPIWASMPMSAGEPQKVGTMIDPASLLPGGRYFRYSGSLTTPPCTEGVLWTVFETPITASGEQIRKFASLFPLDARPVQPLHGRTVTLSQM
jgi:carbonic anhydrase